MTDALAPHIATMAAAGLVVLPGMMTGVLIGGASPVAAVEYQWLLLTAIFAAKSISIALALELAIRGKGIRVCCCSNPEAITPSEAYP